MFWFQTAREETYIEFTIRRKTKWRTKQEDAVYALTLFQCFTGYALLQFICPHRPASWAGSRAGSPVA
jgi:hypothetical protein